MSVDGLLRELRWCAGFEDEAGAVIAARRLAAIAGDASVRAFVGVLEDLDGLDLSEDAGDMADEVSRTRRAVEVGLLECKERAVPHLRPLVGPTGRGVLALRVLAQLGDATVLPVAAAWSEDTSAEGFSRRLAAIEAFGWLKPAEAGLRLRDVLSKPGAQNQGWVKRTAAHALGRLGDVEALEVLLDDEDWFARLGAAEALRTLPAKVAAQALARARSDRDERVRAAAS